jgi:hypothetical protein
VHWGKGGATRLENLVMLCTLHHRLVHEHGYRVELDEQQNAMFFHPTGKRIEAVPPRPRPANVGYVALVAQNAHLGIDPVIEEPPWNYDYPDGDWVCDDGLVPPE